MIEKNDDNKSVNNSEKKDRISDKLQRKHKNEKERVKRLYLPNILFRIEALL